MPEPDHSDLGPGMLFITDDDHKHVAWLEGASLSEHLRRQRQHAGRTTNVIVMLGIDEVISLAAAIQYTLDDCGPAMDPIAEEQFARLRDLDRHLLAHIEGFTDVEGLSIRLGLHPDQRRPS